MRLCPILDAGYVPEDTAMNRKNNIEGKGKFLVVITSVTTRICVSASILLVLVCQPLAAQRIDRRALVERHNIDSQALMATLPVGNGEFAFSMDGTGLQTFAGNTMTHWGWHSFPLPPGYKPEDVPKTATFEQGRLKGGQEWPKEHAALGRWLFDNPHRMSLGRLRLRRIGVDLTPQDIVGLKKHLDLWGGTHTSNFTIDGQPVRVETCAHPLLDMVAVRIQSPLLAGNKLQVQLDFPYPSLKELPTWIGDWGKPDQHQSLEIGRQRARVDIERKVDNERYTVTLAADKGTIAQVGTHAWSVTPTAGTDTLEVTSLYAPRNKPAPKNIPNFHAARLAAGSRWQSFWRSGGAIDLSASKDPRWKELERRIVLSQYHTAVQSAGSLPPPEIGLMSIDGWRSKFHMEMLWWHLAHYALWDRWEMCDKALSFYKTTSPQAKTLAKQLGYEGLMWPKMVGPEARNSVWVGTNILQWKQPHPIFFAELEYRLRPTRKTLEKWKDIVFGTADFMADYPVNNPATGKYSLEPLMTANERVIGKDGAFELAYWRYALQRAEEWRRRLGLPVDPKWREVRRNLAPLPKLGDVYIEVSEWTDNYTADKAWEHPDPVGALGMLPPVEGVDPGIARNTVRKVWESWDWDRTWGWDFPWLAMAAARTDQPQIAIEALLKDSKQNVYPENGINIGWYLPGNGGLLYAVAMMAAGWDGAPRRATPGFPADGSWVVRWEGLKKAP